MYNHQPSAAAASRQSPWTTSQSRAVWSSEEVISSSESGEKLTWSGLPKGARKPWENMGKKVISWEFLVDMIDNLSWLKEIGEWLVGFNGM